MEVESESVDVSSLKLRLLQPFSSYNNPTETRRLRTRQSATTSTASTHSRTNNSHALHRNRPREQSQSVRPPETLPELDSTVPESAEVPNHSISSPVLVDRQQNALHITRPMTTTASPLEATQELSQSIYQGILQRSKSGTHDPTEEETAHEEDDTPHTLHEGDAGHVDFGSSYDLLDDARGDGISSDEEDLPTTQINTVTPRFPDSQRFKTPATIGKKRHYDGSTVDSPEVMKKPMLRPNVTTPGLAMGLSQAFAATQAVSSPLVSDAPPNLLSDRPSPNIDLQTRPVTAATSSPMAPLSEFRRAATEPASRYVSTKQSQDKRRFHHSQDKSPDQEEEFDEFDDEPSIIRRQRAEKERLAGTRRQLELTSSPTRRPRRTETETRSSPIPERTEWDEQWRQPSSIKSPILVNTEIVIPDLPESEAETEDEDFSPVHQRQPTGNPRFPDEDKENVEARAIQVPDTALRLQRIVTGQTDGQASPSVRHVGGSLLTTTVPELSSPRPYAIANSQSSQPRRRIADLLPRSSGGMDFVPQSQHPFGLKSTSSPKRPDGSAGEANLAGIASSPQLAQTATPAMEVQGQSDQNTHSLDPPDHSSKSTSKGNRRLRNTHSTIPETRTEPRSSVTSTDSGKTGHDRIETNRTSESGTRFESARTRIQENGGNAPLVELSSPPIATTPPGLKRKRMADIVSEPSPLRSSANFDAIAALQIDSDFQSSAPSPLRRAALRSTGLADIQMEETHSQSSDKSSSQVTEVEDRNGATSPVSPASSPNSTPTALPLAVSAVRPVVRQVSQVHGSINLLQRHSLRATQTRPTRASVWDLEASPPQKTIPTPKLTESAKPKLASKGVSARRSKKELEVSVQRSVRENVPEDTGSDFQSVMSTKSKICDVPSTHDQGATVAPDMVFACYNGKSRAYYPARCLGASPQHPGRYNIQWDGYDPDEIDEYGIRRLELRVGDAVKVDVRSMPRVSYIVHRLKDKVPPEMIGKVITDIQGFKTVVVAAKQRKSLPANVSMEVLHDVLISSIYLDSNMWNQMKTRLYEHPTAIVRNGYATPSERPASPSTPSSRNRRHINSASTGVVLQAIPQYKGLFANMVFAISYEEPNRKNTLSEHIRSHGGYIAEDSFTELFEADTIDVRANFQDSGFTALLADRHSRKEKYMQALALNIPCLSGRWVEACIRVNAVVDWQEYLLPAGESAELEGATRSRVMTDFDASKMQLRSMLRTRQLMLDDCSVVIVVGKGKAEGKRKPYIFLAQALGASRIERAVDLKTAKAIIEQDSQFSWCFVDDKDVDAARLLLVSKGKGSKKGECLCKVAGNEMIVQSLILGRLYTG